MSPDRADYVVELADPDSPEDAERDRFGHLEIELAREERVLQSRITDHLNHLAGDLYQRPSADASWPVRFSTSIRDSLRFIASRIPLFQVQPLLPELLYDRIVETGEDWTRREKDLRSQLIEDRPDPNRGGDGDRLTKLSRDLGELFDPKRSSHELGPGKVRRHDFVVRYPGLVWSPKEVARRICLKGRAAGTQELDEIELSSTNEGELRVTVMPQQS